MIRTESAGGLVPRDKPDDRGLSGAMARAADGAAEDEARREREEETLQRTTRTLLFDAFYRAKRINGDTGFDHADLAQLDALEAEAARLGERRRGRPGDAP